MVKYFLGLCALCLAHVVCAQMDDSLLNRIDRHIAERISSRLHLHLDKTHYLHGEHIWFTAYLWNDADTDANNTLYILLADPLTQKIVAKDRFAMGNGTGKGQLFLADSLLPGRYELIAYTNLFLETPNQPLFHQAIQLQSDQEDSLAAHAVPVNRPDAKEALSVTLAAEGGPQVTGHLSLLAVEVLKGLAPQAGRHVQILEADRPVADVYTSAHGNGSFWLLPDARKKYTVLVDGTKNEYIKFPNIRADGFTLHIRNDNISDTVEALINPPADVTRCVVVLHRNGQRLYTARAHCAAGGGLVRIPVGGFSAGLATLSVFDEQGRVVAERAVMIGHAHQFQAAVTTDSAAYHTHATAQLTLHITGETGNPIRAICSFSCSRDTGAPMDLPPDNETAQLILLSERYEPVPAHLPRPMACDEGRVTLWDKSIKAPVSLLLVGPGNVQQLQTDSSGRFQLPAELTGDPGSKGFLTVVDRKNNRGYQIRMQDGCVQLNQQVVHALLTDTLTGIAQPSIDRNSLETVIVKTKRNPYYHPHFNDTLNFVSSTCNDYVCINGVLNCDNHIIGGRIPEDGGIYYVFRGSGSRAKLYPTYYHCARRQTTTEYMCRVNLTHTSVPFTPPENAAKIHMYPTLYWDHELVTDEKGEAHINVPTGRPAGDYRYTIEGMTEDGRHISVSGVLKIVE